MGGLPVSDKASVIAAAVGSTISVIAALWLYRIGAQMSAIPKKAAALSPSRWTSEEIVETYKRVEAYPVDFTEHLPPKLERRYIIIGGCGLVGGDIVHQLLQRGQSPESIRVIDYQKPVRADMLSGAVTHVDYCLTDIASEEAVKGAFAKPWKPSVAQLPLTVFHTAAVIRAAERHWVFYERCRRVNVGGTANLLSAARDAGADIFIFTSSASVSLIPVDFWVLSWRFSPRTYYQAVTEKDFFRPLRPHAQFFSNYAYSKAQAERLVCSANENGFRTGAIRPANGVYGQPNDQMVGHLLRSKTPSSFGPQVIQDFVSGRNVAFAHLVFEAALAKDEMPKNAGRPFVVTDPNPSISFCGFYKLAHEMSATPVDVKILPPLPMLLLAYIIEGWCLLLTRLPFLKTLGLAEPRGDILQLQPAVFTVSCNTIADDQDARRPVEEGGLGFRGVITSLEGLCEQVVNWNRAHSERKVPWSFSTDA